MGLLTQVKQFGYLRLSSTTEGTGDVTWPVEQDISLAEFLKGEINEGSIMVRAEKWNHPEYDGLYINTNEQQERELVAWNASEATGHSGNVNKLQVLLREIGNRVEKPLFFDKVRFIFIVPTDNLEAFALPTSSSARLLNPWKFTGFEKMGAVPTRLS